MRLIQNVTVRFIVSIDLKKHFHTFIPINNYCNGNFVIPIDNINF